MESKRRPIVVVGASPMGKNEDQVVLVVPISDVGTPLNGDVPIAEWQKCGLKKYCWVRARRLYAFDPGKLTQVRVGRLPDHILDDVFEEIAVFFR